MKGLDRRLEALERATPADDWREVLDALSLEELDRLERIIMALDKADQGLGSREAAIAQLPDEDQQLLEKVGALRESMT